MAILASANEILVDFNGNRAYLTDDSLYVYDAADVNVVPGFIKHNNSDLGEPSLDKHINGLDVDYKGAFTLTMVFDDEGTYIFDVPNSATRTTKWMHYPVYLREPFQKLYTLLTTSTAGMTIYGLELDFNTVPRRKT